MSSLCVVLNKIETEKQREAKHCQPRERCFKIWQCHLWEGSAQQRKGKQEWGKKRVKKSCMLNWSHGKFTDAVRWISIFSWLKKKNKICINDKKRTRGVTWKISIWNIPFCQMPKNRKQLILNYWLHLQLYWDFRPLNNKEASRLFLPQKYIISLTE